MGNGALYMEDEEEILEMIKRLEKELEPLKKYRISNTCDPHWNMGNIEDMSMLYNFNIFKLRDRISELKERITKLEDKQ